MARSIAAATLAVAASTLLATPTFAQDGPKCGSFVLTGGEKTINSVDNPPDGRSPGDQRVGTRLLVDDAGTQIGEEVFVAITAATGATRGRDLMATEFFFSFSTGWVGGSALFPTPTIPSTPRASTLLLWSPGEREHSQTPAEPSSSRKVIRRFSRLISPASSRLALSSLRLSSALKQESKTATCHPEGR